VVTLSAFFFFSFFYVPVKGVTPSQLLH